MLAASMVSRRRLFAAERGPWVGRSTAQRRDSHSFSPILPDFLDEIEINNLKVGAGTVDLLIHRRAHSATIEILGRSGDVEVITES